MRSAVVLALVVAVAAPACTHSERVDITVTPRTSLADEPIHIVVSGLPARAPVSLELRSKDSAGVTWTSRARFEADGDGRLDLDRTAPISGDYSGVWGSGLLVSMQPDDPLAPSYGFQGTRRFRFHLRVVVSGGERASTTFSRRYTARPLKVLRPFLGRDGFVGEYAAPSDARRRPAVLVLGGSEGRLSTASLAHLLAARGYPALAVAYFGLPGLPGDLWGIRLEYFAKALRWLASRPEVDGSRMFVLGASRGSEAALLLGVHYPRLVHGVIASVPSSVSNGGWTLRGKMLPYTSERWSADPSDVPEAVIPVERIRGPIFVNCGRNDFVWPSCNFARAIIQRLEAHEHPYRRVFHESAAGGHAIGFFEPYHPETLRGSLNDERARERMWPKLLEFLEDASS